MWDFYIQHSYVDSSCRAIAATAVVAAHLVDPLEQHTADRNPTLACACITRVQHFIRYLSSRLYRRTTRVSQTPPTQCALSNLTFIHSADDQCRAPRDLWTKLSSTNTRSLICSTCNTHAHQTDATECHTHHSIVASYPLSHTVLYSNKTNHTRTDLMFWVCMHHSGTNLKLLSRLAVIHL